MAALSVERYLTANDLLVEFHQVRSLSSCVTLISSFFCSIRFIFFVRVSLDCDCYFSLINEKNR